MPDGLMLLFLHVSSMKRKRAYRYLALSIASSMD
jgi:hypothetical protein